MFGLAFASNATNRSLQHCLRPTAVAAVAVQRACRTSFEAKSTAQSSMSSTDDLQAADGKLKLLCLHGFMQNGNILRMRIGSMRKALKSRVHFIFEDAPFHAASTLSEQQIQDLGGSSEGLTWFQWKDLGPAERPSLAVKYSNWETTYSSLCAAMRLQQPDGIFGFSQGATAAALFLASLQTARREGRDLDVPVPKFCIVCAGFLPKDAEYAQLLEHAQVDVPTMFIMGETDRLIPPARSHALMDTFNPQTADYFSHPGAHMIPTCSGEFKQHLLGFLDRFRGAQPVASASIGSSMDSLDTNAATEQDQIAAAVGKL